MPKYKIGDTVWVARFDRGKSVKVPCRVCYGKLKVTLILGNRDHIELPCDYCGKGNFGVPTGYEIEYQPISEPESIIINGMDVKYTQSGEKAQYWDGQDSCHRVYYEENLFLTFKEALARGEELKAKWLADEQTRTDRIKYHAKKSFAWNAGYHMRQVKDHERQAVYHKDKAILCKNKAKRKSDD